MSNFTFTEEYARVEKRVDDFVWIQGQEDTDSIWRFHDRSQMPGFLQPYIVESNNPGEDRFRYRIPDDKFADRNPSFPHSYMFEHRFFFKFDFFPKYLDALF